MANAMYELGRDHFLNGDVDWTGANMKVTLVDGADYTLNITTDEDYADVTAGGRVATSGNMTCTSALGVADASDVTYSTVTGDESEYLVIWYDSTVEATSWLLVNLDNSNTGIPVTPNGSDITVQWDDGANKIFKL